MEVLASTTTVADYCQGIDRGEIVVNRRYQRSDGVWPEIARSYLVESAVLGFPMPKFSLFVITDVTSKKTVREIVDGQQRSMTLHKFYSGELRLSPKLESDLAGLTYEELTGRDQSAFLSYSLSLDLFIAATEEDIRQTFRRMNSYTVPLNAEEQRHADYQGAFKWYVNRLAGQFGSVLVDQGALNEKQLLRMQDAKLFTEVSRALVHGIETTNKAKLNDIYKRKDSRFPEEEEFEKRFAAAFNHVASWESLAGTPIMKPHHLYSLLLAIMHVQEPAEQLQPHYSHRRSAPLHDRSVDNLGVLADAITRSREGSAVPEDLLEFVLASTEGTNVGAARATRFRWYCNALLNRNF